MPSTLALSSSSPRSHHEAVHLHRSNQPGSTNPREEVMSRAGIGRGWLGRGLGLGFGGGGRGETEGGGGEDRQGRGK